MALFKEKKDSTYNRRNSTEGVTILTSGCQFTGKLCCKGASRIGGKIEGEIISEGLLIIEEGAVIDAIVKADEVILHGTFHGKLQVNIKAELTETAIFDGEIQTPSLLVREGAHFNGQVKMPHSAEANFVGIDEIHKKKQKEVNSVPELSITK